MSDRNEYRTKMRKTEVVTVYRDRKSLPYDQAIAALSTLAPVYKMFSVVAVVADASQQGLGLKIEGQQRMTSNMLQPDERYLLKLTLPDIELNGPRPAFLRRDGDLHFLLLKAVCRWVRSGDTSTAGFSLVGNSDDLAEFVRDYFGPRRHVGTWT